MRLGRWVTGGFALFRLSAGPQKEPICHRCSLDLVSDDDSIIVLLAIVILTIGGLIAATELPTSQSDRFGRALSRHTTIAVR
jgi:hypothetical protein